MLILVDNEIVPPTSKTMVRAPESWRAARSEPGPESFRFVTRTTAPRRPAGVVTPNPCAPGNTGSASTAELVTTIQAVSAHGPFVAVIVAPPGATAVTSPLG